MNKTELVAAMAEKAGIPKKDADKALSAFISTVEDALKNGDKIQLVGFGTFEVRERAARTCLNPQTKAKIEVPASKVPAFKVGQGLKNLVK